VLGVVAVKLSVSKYAYISARVKGMKVSLLDQEGYRTLLGYSDLVGIYGFLKDTPYVEELGKVTPEALNALSLERVFLMNLFKTFNKVVFKSPSDVASIIIDYLKKFDVENVKMALRALRAAVGGSEAMKYILPVPSGIKPEIYGDLLTVAENVEGLIRLMERTEYGVILTESLEEYLVKKSLMPVENALDVYVYRSLWADIEKLGRRDREIAGRLFGIETDVDNIRVVLRCKALGLKAEEAMGYIFPAFYALNHEDIEKALEASSVSGAMTPLMVQPYRDMLTKVLMDYERTGSISAVDIEGDRLIASMNRHLLRIYPSPFHIGVVLSYLNLKWFEVKNLVALVYGKEDGLSPDVIEKSLIY